MNETNSMPVVLVADDSITDRKLTVEAFKQAHLTNPIHEVKDGEELMDYLLRRARYAGADSAARPVLILLDLNMPRKNGLEALNEIKNCPDLKGIPVILLTTSAAERDIASSYDLGANSYITKPLNFDDFLGVVKQLGEYWLELVSLPRVH